MGDSHSTLGEVSVSQHEMITFEHDISEFLTSEVLERSLEKFLRSKPLKHVWEDGIWGQILINKPLDMYRKEFFLRPHFVPMPVLPTTDETG